MPKFKSELKGIKVNKDVYLRDLNNYMEDQLKKAAVEWVTAVAANVPVYSGMAQSSLIPLVRFLDINMSVSTAPGAPDRRAEGEELGNFTFDTSNMRYVFEFSTEVPHYLINEFNGATGKLGERLRHPTPWESFEAGRNAFNSYLDTEFFRNAPQIASYVKFTRIRS